MLKSPFSRPPKGVQKRILNNYRVQGDMEKPLRIGTRGSPMAVFQANHVRDRLLAVHSGLEAEVVIIQTTGDKVQDRTLAEIGGKGLFTKEIEQGLFDGSIDIAVHSMKDVETVLPDGLVIATLLPRDDPRDAFISHKADSLAALPAGSVVGTASMRRQAQIRMVRPDLRVQPIRGNAGTRLRKLEEGEADATLLAIAGLRRIGKEDVAACILEPEEMLPAVAQGAIGVEAHNDNTAVLDLLAVLHDADTAYCIGAERALLAALDGSCRTPIAALAEIEGGLELVMRALIASPDGTESHTVSRRGPLSDATAMGADAGRELRARASPDIFS